VANPLAGRVVDRSFLDKGYRDVRIVRHAGKRPMGEPDASNSAAAAQSSVQQLRGS
jgi:hypothetical protein